MKIHKKNFNVLWNNSLKYMDFIRIELSFLFYFLEKNADWEGLARYKDKIPGFLFRTWISFYDYV